ncbi:hypothetical protein ACQ4N7_28960 [Nodosilinea sp. AN01ver1]|uniref:hypothetical protein n=1 Tax=Nodosilinea sp. AN01ver1 TaxID=3423362 RepID=UPI003D317510
MAEQNISEKLLQMLQDAKEKSGAKGSLRFYVDHYLENGHGTELEAELAFLEMQENPEPTQPTRRDSVEKNPYSEAISSKRVARGKQPLNTGANFENTVKKPKR